jgi:putative transposase
MTVRRIKQSERVLDELQHQGYDVGRLQWKAPGEFRSIVYNQSGFDVDRNTGRTDHATVDFSKIGTFHVRYHRPVPADSEIRQVILKRERTGDWTVSIVVDYDPDYPAPPAVEEIDPDRVVGIDLGITKFIHDSDGRAFRPLDETADRERIDRRHRDLSRKERGSRNWEQARRRLARAYDRVQNRRNDYREKLAHEYTTHYDAVFLEDLDVTAMAQGERNSRNLLAMSWRKTIQAFERHGKKNGCHVIEVPPEGTTKRCSQCWCATEKPLWVREHRCPSCGFEADRDYNSVLEIKRLGLTNLGVRTECQQVGQGMAVSMPAETALPAGTTVVPAKRVVETGSPCLKEPPRAASRQG